MSIILWSFLIVLYLAAWLGVLGCAMWLAMEHEKPIPAILVGIVGSTFLVALGWWVLSTYTGESNLGVHSWKGGSGPGTVCEYEVKQTTKMVGKVPVSSDEVFTICRDQK